MEVVVEVGDTVTELPLAAVCTLLSVPTRWYFNVFSVVVALALLPVCLYFVQVTDVGVNLLSQDFFTTFAEGSMV